MRKTNILLCLVAMSVAGVSSGALIQTDPNGLAFHARATTATSGFYELQNSGTDVNGTVHVPPATGFAGSLMWIAGQMPGTGGEVDASAAELADGLQSYAEYTVRFASQGTYRVFWAGQRTSETQSVGEGSTVGGNDSVWVGSINQNHTATTGWVQYAIAAGTISYRSTAALWVIDGTTVDTDLTFTVGLREDGPIYDRIAFVLEGSGVAPTALEVIPEPSSIVLAIAAIGLIGIKLRRRA